MKIDVLDHGYVRLVESWGKGDAHEKEAGIIEAARQSTAKGFQGWGADAGAGAGRIRSNVDLPAGDDRLLRYLYEHHHDSPFEFAGMVIEVQAPLFVFREWHRHRTQSYNEMSGRYTVLPDLYYVPSVERLMASKQATANVQSSQEGISQDTAEKLRSWMVGMSWDCRKWYEELLGYGIAREVARMVLPVNQYSRMRASANLRNWLAFLTLRLAPNAQWEIRQYAEAVATIVQSEFPRTYALFKERYEKERL